MTNKPDHIIEAERIQAEIYRQMPPARRLEIALDLNRMARAMKTAAIKQRHPDWTDEQVQKAVRDIYLYAHS